MNIDEIKLLHEYNDWADARILAACALITGGAALAAKSLFLARKQALESAA